MGGYVQLTWFEEKHAARQRKPGQRQVRLAGSAPLPPVAPPDLRQESALWLCGQRSIETQRGRRYVPRSVQHPGKMHPDVAGAIIDTYTRPGDVILDPMGGIGTTAVEAAERGRHVVLVEIVPRWAKVAWCNALRTAYRGAPGTIRVIQGDARRLPELVAGAFDHLVTSPPYGEALEPRTGRVEGRTERLRRLIAEGTLPRRDWRVRGGLLASVAPSYTPAADAVVTSPVYGDSRISNVPRGVTLFAQDGGYPHTGSLPRGYDAVVTSPPFGPTQTGRGIALSGINGYGRPPVKRGLGVPYDAVITSPAYGDTRVHSLPSDVFAEGRVIRESEVVRGYDPMVACSPYGEALPENGGHVGEQWRYCNAMRRMAGGDTQVDAVVTSPAYGDIRQDGGSHQFGKRAAMTNYTGEARIRRGRDRSNVGNLRYGSLERALAVIARLRAGEQIPESEWPSMEYLETMALIYWHCWHLVKPGGLAVLVLKDYRRDKARVNLVGDTIQIMTAVGWIYHDQALALTSRVNVDEAGAARVVSKVSPFVRINARKPQKNGGPVLLPAGEVVLVFRKP